MSKNRLNIVLGILLAFLVAVTLYVRHGSKKYRVENFVGRSEQDVIVWMENNKVPSERVVFNYSYSDIISENTVISQNIKENKMITGNNSLIITVSSGEDPNKKISLPDFSEMNQSDIEIWLSENNITNYRFETEINEDIPEGNFLRSKPVAGTRLNSGDEIIITICEHDHSTTVEFPDFTGQTINEIEEWATKNNIEVNYIYYTDNSAAGSFLFSDIPVGTVIDKGGRISVAVSSGIGQ